MKSALLILVVIALTGCKVTIPAEETLTLTSSKSQRTRDEVERCVQRLNDVRGEAKTQLYAGTTLAVVGGTAGIAGGTVGVLADEKDAKTAGAITAGIGALTALVGAYIGQPADTLKEHNDRWAYFRRIKKMKYEMDRESTYTPRDAQLDEEMFDAAVTCGQPTPPPPPAVEE